jgi:hypothetical protein
MMKRVRQAAGLAALLAVWACTDQSNNPPTQPSARSNQNAVPDQAALEAQISNLINSLYAPKDQGRVFAKFAQIKAAIASGRTSDAQAAIVAFFASTLADSKNGVLQDPNGAQPPTTTEALTSLLNTVAVFGGLPAPIPSPSTLSGDGAVAVIGATGGTLVSSSGFGGVRFPSGALPGDVIVVVSRLPNPAQPKTGPLPTTFDQYPLFYDFSTFPRVAQFGQPVTVGVCQLEVGAPFAPATQSIADRLQVAHPDPTNPATVQLLQRADASFIHCDGVSLASAERDVRGTGFGARALAAVRAIGPRMLAFVTPTPAYAVHGGLGGLTSSFSPFGAVDPGLSIVGVCASPMAGVSQTFGTLETAIANVTPGGIVRVCSQTINVATTILVTKPVTIEAETPALPPQINISSIVGFTVAPTLQGSVTFRSLAFTLLSGASSAIDLGTGQAPAFPAGTWWEVLVENNSFSFTVSGVGRAVRAFYTMYNHPRLTFRANQTVGGTFPVVTLTGMPTSTIQVLSNTFTGPTSAAPALIQNEGTVLVDGNTFASCGSGASCLILANVADATVTNNTFFAPTGSTTRAGVAVSGGGSASISGNAFSGGTLSGVAADTLSYRFRLGGIVVTPNGIGGSSATDASTAATAHVTASQNSIDNASAGIRIIGGGATVTGSDNVMTRTQAALRLDNASGTGSSLAITHTDFSSYFTPMWTAFLSQSSTIDATCNFWGSASGPQNLAVGIPVGVYLPFSPAPIANGAGGTCTGTNGAASSSGVYARAHQIGAFLHTERAIVSGPSVTAHHAFTNGTSSGTFDWTGTISASAATPMTGTIAGGGNRFDSCCGTVAFTLTSGSIVVNANGTASLSWNATSSQFGAFGETDSRLSAPLAISDVNTPSGLPANLGAITGSVNVSSLIGPTAGTPSHVDLVVGSTVVASLPLDAQTAPGAVWLSFNSATVANGSYTMSARLYTTQGGNSPVATVSLPIVINN